LTGGISYAVFDKGLAFKADGFPVRAGMTATNRKNRIERKTEKSLI